MDLQGAGWRSCQGEWQTQEELQAKVSCDKRKAGRQRRRERERTFVTRAIMETKWCVKNIILSLVSTQFVMSFTHSLNRLETEMSHKTSDAQGHPAKWQILTNDAIKAPLNVPNSIEEKISCCLQKHTDNRLWVSTRSAHLHHFSPLSFDPVGSHDPTPLARLLNFSGDIPGATLKNLKSDLILLRKLVELAVEKTFGDCSKAEKFETHLKMKFINYIFNRSCCSAILKSLPIRRICREERNWFSNSDDRQGFELLFVRHLNRKVLNFRVNPNEKNSSNETSETVQAQVETSDRFIETFSITGSSFH